MRLAIAAVVASILAGCAGWQRELDTRMTDDDGDVAVALRCDSVPAIDGAALALPVTVEAPRGFQPVGELFDNRLAPRDAPESSDPRRHALVVDASALALTVHEDVERLLGSDDALEGGLRLVVRIVDVRTVARGTSSLRGRIASRVVLVAELRGDRGAVLWKKVLGGKAEKGVFAFRLVNYEASLSAAYCSALGELRAAAPEVAVTLATLAAGGAVAVPVKAESDPGGVAPDTVVPGGAPEPVAE